VAAIEQLVSLPLGDLTEKLDPYGVIRLTYQRSRLASLQSLEIDYQYKTSAGDVIDHFSAPVRLEWIDIALMPQQIGFLFLKVRLEEIAVPVERFNDLLYYIRQIHKPTIDWQLPSWKLANEKEEYEFTSRDLVDFLLQGFTGTQPNPGVATFSLNDWLNKKDSVQRYSSTERGQVYGQTFRLYSYACLVEEGNDSAGPASVPNTTAPSATQKEPVVFASPMEQALYELATCTNTTDQEQDYMPHAMGVKQIMEKGHIALWRNWEAMALHDNVVFLGARSTGFTRVSLPHNVEFDYFQLYLLALYQKTRLSMLSGELMRRGDDLYENLHEARELWDAFTMFRNHYWCAEVTFKPQGIELYRRFQSGLNVFTLYESVNHEVRELQQYYERKADQEMAEATRILQQGMAKNVELTRELQESTNQAVVAAKEIANRQLALTQVMKENLEATNRLQEDMTAQLRIGSNIQIKIEWIEIFVVGFYTAELAHTLIDLFEKNYHFELWWSTLLILGSGLISGLITWALLKPSQH
jgi:hypothetical protein